MALWVAFGHAFMDLAGVVNHHNGNNNFFPQQFFRQGFFAHFAVDVFIVVSGFCLMLPVAKNGNYALSGGWQGYLIRRARRILPPYYSALLLALAIAGIRYWITAPNVESWYIQHIDFRPSAIIAHILLVQNLWDPWARAVDGPTWSVATEFQIYLLFPLMLIPLWRRCSPLMVVTVGYGIGVALLFATWPGHRGDFLAFPTWLGHRSGLTSCAWFIGLFAMGMASAQWHVRSRTVSARPFLAVMALALITVVVLVLATQQWTAFLMCYLDFAVGGAGACILAYCSSFEPGEARNILMRVLEWSPLVTVGAFSYSLYLIHAPILNLPVTLLLRYDANGIVGAITIASTLVAIVLIARVFYKYIELPSMMKRKRSA